MLIHPGAVVAPILLTITAALGASAAGQDAAADPEANAGPTYVRLLGEPRPLMSTPTHEYHGCWSPDGKRIGFARRDDEVSYCTFWTLDPATGAEEHIDVHVVGDMHFGWAGGGKEIVFDARDEGGPPYVCRYSFETKETRRLTPEGVVATQPACSRDGRFACYGVHTREGTQIWIYDLEKEEARQVTQGGAPDKARPRFSADGESIIYIVQQGRRTDYHRVDIATGESEPLTDDPHFHSFVTCSPDGSLLAFDSRRRDGHDIWVMPATGGAMQRLISSRGQDAGPDWSPDGRQIVFCTTREGTFDLWIADVEILQRRQRQQPAD
ncbi:MAG: hypothetical protein ACF8NJ_09405 [Phycisphaerales bacterium JB038]